MFFKNSENIFGTWNFQNLETVRLDGFCGLKAKVSSYEIKVMGEKYEEYTQETFKNMRYVENFNCFFIKL